MSGGSENLYLLLVAGMGGAILLVVLFILLHMRNQNRLMVQRDLLQQAEIDHQRSLLSAVITSQESERRRIGRDLHDDVGSALANLRLNIDMFDTSNISADNYNRLSAACKTTIDNIITDVRHISHNLSPPRLALFGLNAALEDLVDIIPRSGLKLVMENDATDVFAKLDITVATTLYRIFEELIHNTIKHAAAAHIFIIIKNDDNSLLIDYSDDGIGLYEKGEGRSKKGMGMQNIESRLNMISAAYQMSRPGEPGFSIGIKHDLAV